MNCSVIRSSLLAALLTILGNLVAVEPIVASEQRNQVEPERQLVRPPSAFFDACRRFEWLCESRARSSESIGPEELLERAEEINKKVNFAVAYVSDPENFGSADHWALPRWGRGDCEDYVLKKYQLLVEEGIDNRYFSVAIARTRGQNHAVLVVHHSSGDLVLDNFTNKILPWNETGYRYLAMQTRDDKRAWEVVAYQSRDSAVLAQR